MVFVVVCEDHVFDAIAKVVEDAICVVGGSGVDERGSNPVTVCHRGKDA